MKTRSRKALEDKNADVQKGEAQIVKLQKKQNHNRNIIQRMERDRVEMEVYYGYFFCAEYTDLLKFTASIFLWTEGT